MRKIYINNHKWKTYIKLFIYVLQNVFIYIFPHLFQNVVKYFYIYIISEFLHLFMHVGDSGSGDREGHPLTKCFDL